MMSLIRDRNARIALFRDIKNIPWVYAKADWLTMWIQNQSSSFATRLIALAVVEGIFFSSSFASISWFNLKKGLMPGLCFSNKLILRDEALYTSFACLLFQQLLMRPETRIVHQMVEEAVELEKHFAEGNILHITRVGKY